LTGHRSHVTSLLGHRGTVTALIGQTPRGMTGGRPRDDPGQRTANGGHVAGPVTGRSRGHVRGNVHPRGQNTPRRKRNTSETAAGVATRKRSLGSLVVVQEIEDRNQGGKKRGKKEDYCVGQILAHHRSSQPIRIKYSILDQSWHIIVLLNQ